MSFKSQLYIVVLLMLASIGQALGQNGTTSDGDHDYSLQPKFDTLSETLKPFVCAFKPYVDDVNPMATGVVRINVVLDSTGMVVTASFSPKGSTIADNHVIQRCIHTAKAWKWKPDPALHNLKGWIAFQFKPL